MPEDIDVVYEFIHQMAIYEKCEDDFVTDKQTLYTSLFEEKAVECLLLREEGNERVIGFTVFFHNFSTFLGRAGIYLEDLYVKPDYRGRGHGKALIKELADIAVKRGCGRLEWSCLDWNTPSIDFYLSLGAKQMNEWTVYRFEGESLANLAKKE